MAIPKVNWTGVDWRQSDEALAKLLGQPLAIVAAQREKAEGYQTILIDRVVVDHDLQPRMELSAETITRYMDAMIDGSRFPPVVLFDDGKVFWLADGFHRVSAARKWHSAGGPATIRAEVRSGTRRDALVHAVGANATHGLPRSNADKRRCVAMLLGDPEWAEKTDREIARAAAVDHRFVGNVRIDEGAHRDVRVVQRGDSSFSRRVGPGADPLAAPPPADAPLPTVKEWRGLPLGLLSQVGSVLRNLRVPDPGPDGTVRLWTDVGAVRLRRLRSLGGAGFITAPELTRYEITSVQEPLWAVEVGGGGMSKTLVTRVLRSLVKRGAVVHFEVQAQPLVADQPAPASSPAQVPPASRATPAAPVKVKRTTPKAPAPEPSPGVTFNSPPPPAEPEAGPEMPADLRRIWTVLTSLSEAMEGHLARLEACWKAGTKEIVALAKDGARPVRPSVLAAMRKETGLDGDQVVYHLALIRKQLENVTPYQLCDCPPDRQGGGGGNVHGGVTASHCLDCSGRRWLARFEAQVIEKRRSKVEA